MLELTAKHETAAPLLAAAVCMSLAVLTSSPLYQTIKKEGVVAPVKV